MSVPSYHKKGWNLFREEFVRNSLRQASLRWPARTIALKAVRVARRVNPLTGRACWYGQCRGCRQEFLERELAVDHVEPVVPVVQETRARAYSPEQLGALVSRMLPEPSSLQCLCFACHDAKTVAENEARRAGRVKTTKKDR